MPSLDHAIRTVHDTILNQFQAAHSEQSAVQLAFEFGTPVPTKAFESPSEPGGYSTAKVVEFLSGISNFVPDLSDSLVERGLATIDGQYELMLVGSTVRDAGHLEFFAAIKDSAKRDFDNTLGLQDANPVRFRPVYGTPANWYDPVADENWTRYQFNAADEPPATPVKPSRFNLKLMQWQVVPAALRSIIQEPITSAASLNVVSEIADAVALPVPAAVTSSASSTINRAALFQDHVFRDRQAVRFATPREVQFNRRTTMEAARLPSHFAESARVHSPISNLAQRGPLLIDRAALNAISLQNVVTPQPVVTDRMSLSFQTCIVLLNRPWLSDGFLNLPNWYVPFYRKGHFSGGVDAKLFTNIPVACVLLRNLTIQAQWSPDDANAVANSANIGPFSLLGRDFDQASGSLTIPGMQVVAWICDTMPMLPPNDDPTLEGG